MPLEPFWMTKRTSSEEDIDWIPGKMNESQAKEYGFTQVEPGDCELCDEPPPEG